jgi:hypothetical protein
VAAAGILISPFIVSTGIFYAGFTTAGIVKGSLGAAFMKTYGGFIAKGAIISSMQSIGAAGLGYTTYIYCAAPAAYAFYDDISVRAVNAGQTLKSWLF